jgi:hypothetical protein
VRTDWFLGEWYWPIEPPNEVRLSGGPAAAALLGNRF